MLLTEYNEKEQRKLDQRDAYAEGKAEAVDALCKKMNLPIEEACDIIGISKEEYEMAKR